MDFPCALSSPEWTWGKMSFLGSELLKSVIPASSGLSYSLQTAAGSFLPPGYFGSADRSLTNLASCWPIFFGSM